MDRTSLCWLLPYFTDSKQIKLQWNLSKLIMGYEILGNLTFNKFYSWSRNHDDIIIFQLQGSLLYQLVFHYKVNETSAYSSHQKSKFDDSSKINWNPFSNTFILQSKNFGLQEVRIFFHSDDFKNLNTL